MGAEAIEKRRYVQLLGVTNLQTSPASTCSIRYLKYSTMLKSMGKSALVINYILSGNHRHTCCPGFRS